MDLQVYLLILVHIVNVIPVPLFFLLVCSFVRLFSTLVCHSLLTQIFQMFILAFCCVTPGILRRFLFVCVVSVIVSIQFSAIFPIVVFPYCSSPRLSLLVAISSRHFQHFTKLHREALTDLTLNIPREEEGQDDSPDLDLVAHTCSAEFGTTTLHFVFSL